MIRLAPTKVLVNKKNQVDTVVPRPSWLLEPVQSFLEFAYKVFFALLYELKYCTWNIYSCIMLYPMCVCWWSWSQMLYPMCLCRLIIDFGLLGLIIYLRLLTYIIVFGRLHVVVVHILIWDKRKSQINKSSVTCNDVKSGWPTSISKHNPNTFTAETGWNVWCDRGMNLPWAQWSGRTGS